MARSLRFIRGFSSALRLFFCVENCFVLYTARVLLKSVYSSKGWNFCGNDVVSVRVVFFKLPPLFERIAFVSRTWKLLPFLVKLLQLQRWNERRRFVNCKWLLVHSIKCLVCTFIECGIFLKPKGHIKRNRVFDYFLNCMRHKLQFCYTVVENSHVTKSKYIDCNKITNIGFHKPIWPSNYVLLY